MKRYEKELYAVALGDNDALKTIYIDIKDELYRFAYSILHNHEASEDILQDTIIKVREKKIMDSLVMLKVKAVCFRSVQPFSVSHRCKDTLHLI